MFDFQHSIFGGGVTIPPDTQVIFVSDMFVEDYVGGAELTSQALIDACPLKLAKVKSKDVSVALLQEHSEKFWVFGNFAQMDMNLIPSIVGNLRYSVLEYDYKYCQARSPEKHQEASGRPCDCANQLSGKMISAFFVGSMGVWWMSDKQKERYLTAFPFLADKSKRTLSSVFDGKTLSLLRSLRLQNAAASRQGWIVLGSESWIKGADDAKKWCEETGKQYEVVWNLPYEQVLRKLATAEGFVYLPKGGDTCPRMVIEAKLLGCKLHVNDNVQHKDESWFATDDLTSIEGYLDAAPAVFWDGIQQMTAYRPTVSGYVTAYNCIDQKYPFRQCIESMLAFCDEVCVVDGGSTDGTFVHLRTWAQHEPKLKVKQVKRDWTSKRHPVFDGMQKAEARAMCSKEFCWQMDSDEVVHEDDAAKVTKMCRAFVPGADVVALPVIEYWGGPDKVRMDVQPWKWRLSRNLPHITHGIPQELRRVDKDGNFYAAEGTDGCDMIHKETGERLPCANFYSQDADNARRFGMMGNLVAQQQYEQWFNQVVSSLPCVFHYSWYDLPRKIRLYRDYWQNHWNALWDKDASDTAENNLMFGVPWKDVTDEMIETRAAEMKAKLGGWIWHRPWDGKATTPHIKCNRTQPKVMQ